MPRRRLLIATSNLHKLEEIRAFLHGVNWDIVGLNDFPPCDAPEETGETFAENAIIKATAYGAHTGVACVADDSGLVVDALAGEPGVRSARYAGDDATDPENNAKLLQELAHVDDAERTARFVCCAALVLPGERAQVETGVVDGRIAHEVRGTNGFGYDPLFIPQGYAQTFGELDPSIKAAISHRSRAFGKLRAVLEAL